MAPSQLGYSPSIRPDSRTRSDDADSTPSRSTGNCNKTLPDVSDSRLLVVNGSINILRSFLFIWKRRSASLVCRMIDYPALNAAMILILDAWETGDQRNMELVNRTRLSFIEMQLNGAHKLAEAAVKRISNGLAQLLQRSQEPRHHTVS